MKVKISRYRPGVAQRVGRGIALLFHDRGTRRGWVVSSTPWPHFTTGKDPVPTVKEAGWALGPVWTSGKSRPHLNSIPGRPARSQSLYLLSYPAHYDIMYHILQKGERSKRAISRCVPCSYLVHPCSNLSWQTNQSRRGFPYFFLSWNEIQELYLTLQGVLISPYPDLEGNELIFLSDWREFPSAP